jgi:polar amino acid transport system permease protein
MSILLRQLLNRFGRGLFAGRAARGADSAPRGWRTRLMWRAPRTLPTER